MPSSGSGSVGDGVLQVWVGVSDGGVSGGQDTGTAGYIRLRKESLVCFFTWKINTWITLGYTVTQVYDSLMKGWMYLSEEGMSEESCRRRPERQTHT